MSSTYQCAVNSILSEKSQCFNAELFKYTVVNNEIVKSTYDRMTGRIYKNEILIEGDEGIEEDLYTILH
jgi:hypothetical protein